MDQQNQVESKGLWQTRVHGEIRVSVSAAEALVGFCLVWHSAVLCSCPATMGWSSQHGAANRTRRSRTPSCLLEPPPGLLPLHSGKTLQENTREMLVCGTEWDTLPSSHLPGGDVPPGHEEVVEATNIGYDDGLLTEWKPLHTNYLDQGVGFSSGEASASSPQARRLLRRAKGVLREQVQTRTNERQDQVLQSRRRSWCFHTLLQKQGSHQNYNLIYEEEALAFLLNLFSSSLSSSTHSSQTSCFLTGLLTVSWVQSLSSLSHSPTMSHKPCSVSF